MRGMVFRISFRHPIATNRRRCRRFPVVKQTGTRPGRSAPVHDEPHGPNPPERIRDLEISRDDDAYGSRAQLGAATVNGVVATAQSSDRMQCVLVEEIVDVDVRAEHTGFEADIQIGDDIIIDWNVYA